MHGEIVSRVGVQGVGVPRSHLGGEYSAPDENAAVGATRRHQVLTVVRPPNVGHVAAVARVLPEAAAFLLVETGCDDCGSMCDETRQQCEAMGRRVAGSLLTILIKL